MSPISAPLEPADSPEVAAPPDRVAAVVADMGRAFHTPGPGLPVWLGQDLTLAQVRTLFLIARRAPVPMGRIAEILGVSVASASGIVDRLERHGLVGRKHRMDDRRIVDCVLTDVGRGLIDAMSGRRIEEARRALAVLTPTELAEFHRLICLIADRSVAESNVGERADSAATRPSGQGTT
jgi:DNA-binding MarR family transcriptional regulator